MHHLIQKILFRFSVVSMIFIMCLLYASTPVFAAASAFKTINITNLVLNKSSSAISAKGNRPVVIKDNLKVTGDITLNSGKKVDGVDVSALAATVAALQLGTGGVTYTAGTGVSISGTAISSTLGTSIESAELTDATVTADDLSDNSVGASELANTAIQNGDIETADLPNDLTITGGTINNTTIGATTASTGNFSNLALNGTSPVLPALGSVPQAIVNTTIDTIGQGPSTTIGVDGFPIISYVDSTNRDLKVAHCENVNCSSSTITTVSDDGRLYTAIIIGADGLPVIVYDRFSSNGVMVVKCGNTACSSGNTTSVIEAVSIRLPSISIGADGLPVLAYNEVSGADLKAVKCGNAACSSGNTITTIDNDSVVSFGPTTIVVPPDGLPVIAYHKYSSAFDLKVAKCTLADCSTSTTEILDTPNNVGLYSSLVIGVDGLPIVSYYDDSNDNLMIAKCGDATCTNASATITTVDSTGNVGSGNTITIGPDGFPIVAYMDETNGYIKVLKCSTLSCATGNTTTAVVNLNTTSFFYVHILSLTMGRNNLPFIAYFHQGDESLRTAALGSIFGSGYFIRR